MSFTAEVKDELSRIEPKRACCLKAELAALVRIEGTLHITGPNRYRLEVATETAPVARAVIKLLHGVYGLKTELTVRRSVLHKTNNYLITVPSQTKLAGALSELGILGEHGFSLGIDAKLVKKDCCAISYLRGAFLGGGFVADPHGDFHFELTAETEQLADDLVALMARFEIPARVAKRRGTFAVYLKGAEPIVTFLALVGEALDRAVGLENLPPALGELAELRLANPELSLRELGELADPPLTKSAVYHRVRRIEELAAEVAFAASGDE
jgi:cell division protein WhiA